ncbi:MAG TPA: YkgJ family cysteine cluster protein [Pirellulaceae bacterium]|jgi:Fe-S-cluster containining protein|nr:YkgJ family cysteine cluster protein [Pirellulaceae bacterium]
MMRIETKRTLGLYRNCATRQFLGEDDRCTIYDVRPAVCREYPHTDKDGFTFRTMSVANNAIVCPAVFWIVEQMKREALE